MVGEAVKREERLLKVAFRLKVTEGFLPGMGGLDTNTHTHTQKYIAHYKYIQNLMLLSLITVPLFL